MEQSILLVYNIAGDSPDSKFYLIPVQDLTDFEKEALDSSQNKYINIDDDTEKLLSIAARVEVFTEEDKEDVLSGYSGLDKVIPQDIQENIGKWNKYQLDINKLVEVNVKKIYNMGWML